MQKCIKTITYLLLALYVANVNLSHAVDDEADEVSKKPLAVINVGDTRVTLRGAGNHLDDEGRNQRVTRFAAAGVDMAVATHQAGGDSEEFRRRIALAGEIESTPYTYIDARTHTEQSLDAQMLRTYEELVQLRDGLRDFVTGKTATQLTTLAKAVAKLKLERTQIGEAVRIFPELVGRVKREAIALKEALGIDLPRILTDFNQIVEHCEHYITRRRGPAQGIRLVDGISPQDARQGAARVSLERVEITEINRMFKEVEKTLHGMIQSKLSGRLSKLKDFLAATNALQPATSGEIQIKELSQVFANDFMAIEFIDQQWSSIGQPAFAPFKEGVKQTNILLEIIIEFAKTASAMADAEYVKPLLLEKRAEGVAATAVVVQSELQVLEEIVQRGGLESTHVAARMSDLQHTIGRVREYLASPVS